LGWLQRILGIGTNTLRDLIARGPGAANLVYERMQALDISKRDAKGVMLDLQRTCACCNEKDVCEWDLAERPDDPESKSYCPNAVTLDDETGAGGR
jgi:hypothetical protein